jgi:deazaflavin-dependent oxidoreductase (nitroreductase family)
MGTTGSGNHETPRMKNVTKVTKVTKEAAVTSQAPLDLPAPTRRQQVTSLFHRHVANPVMRRLSRYVPGQAVIETVGRLTGLPRRTPVGGRVIDGSFWLVSDHGLRSHYVRNIQANPRVRLRIGARWYAGTAHLVPDDDPHARLRRLPWLNSLMVRMLGTDLLTVRVDLSDSAGSSDETPGTARS